MIMINETLIGIVLVVLLVLTMIILIIGEEKENLIEGYYEDDNM